MSLQLATSTSIAKCAGCDAARATSISVRRISACSNISWRGLAVYSLAPSYSTPSGVRPQKSTSEPSTSMSDAYEKRCRRGTSAIRTLRSTGYAFDETFGEPKKNR